MFKPACLSLIVSLLAASPALAQTRTYLDGEVTVSSVTGATISTYLRMKSELRVEGQLVSEQRLADGGVRLTFAAGASARLSRYANQEVAYASTLPAGSATIRVDITSDHLRVVYSDGARSITLRSLVKKLVVTSDGYTAMPSSVVYSTHGAVTVERPGLGPVRLDDAGALLIVGGTARLGGPTWELGGTDWDLAPELGGTDWDLAPELGGTDYDFRIPATAAVAAAWEAGAPTQWFQGGIVGGVLVRQLAEGGTIVRVGPVATVYDSAVDIHDIYFVSRAYALDQRVTKVY